MSSCCCGRCATQPWRFQELVGDRRVDLVEADLMRRSALLWHFTVLGEAASQVPAELKDSHPKIAWRAATRLRTPIVHGYWDIDVETLVTTAAEDIPQMIVQVEGAIATLEDPEAGPAL